MKMVPSPKFETPPVEPFRREEVEAILKACDFCQEARTNDRHKFTMRRVTGFRDKAIILVLVDSGMRASELCSLRIGDCDSQIGKVQIRHRVGGGAKGKKGRTVYLGKQQTRSPRCPNAAPMAAGRSYPIEASPVLAINRWPLRSIPAWITTTLAVPLPQTTTSFACNCPNNRSTK